MTYGITTWKIKFEQPYILIKAVLLFIILILGCKLSLAQESLDSLQQLQNDSLAKIPTVVETFEADEATHKVVLDSGSSLLHKRIFTGRTLNNYYTAEFRLSNERYTNKIYDHGINTMPFRMMGFDNYAFLSSNKPVAEITLQRGRAFLNSQAAFGDNFDLHLVFAENFRNRLIWNFSYDKDSYKGLYQLGLQKNTLFTTGVQYSGKEDKFHLNVVFLDERHALENNWGIQSDSVFSDDNFDVRESIKINNTVAATTAIYERSLGVNVDFPIAINSTFLNPVVYFKSFYSDYSYNYFDESTSDDSAVYKQFWIDPDSIRHKLDQRTWTHALQLSLLSTDKMEGKLGFRYELQRYDHDTLETVRNLYQFEAEARYRILDNMELSGNAALKKFEQTFAPEIKFDLELKVNDYLSSNFGVFLKSDPVPYIYQKLVLNKKYFWHNDFQNTFIKEKGITASLNTLKIIHSKIQLSWSSFSDFVYLNQYSVPRIIDGVDKFTIHCELPISFFWFQFNNSFHYHVFTPDPGNFSGWNSSHKLSLYRSLFRKVVNADIGGTLRLYNYTHQLNFNPLMQLYFASDVPSEFIYSVGAFFHFRVSDFSFLIDLDNIDSFWITKRPSLVTSYPFYDFMFKFGINWRFVD